MIKKSIQNVIYAVKWEIAYHNLRAPKTREDMIINEKKVRDTLCQAPIPIVELQLDIKDFKKAVSLLRNIDPEMPLIIQPVMNGETAQISTERLFKLQNYASRFLKTTLIIPQVHKILGVK